MNTDLVDGLGEDRWDYEGQGNLGEDEAELRVNVDRDGDLETIEQRNLVLGDLIKINTKYGKVIPADIYITWNSPDFKVNNTLLGKSGVALKAMKDGSKIDNFFEAGNIAFAGSEIMSGEAQGIVMRLGKDRLIHYLA